MPIAGICSRCASASIGATFAAPSNIEYSVWLCRCTNDWLIGTPVYGRTPTSPRRVGKGVLFIGTRPYRRRPSAVRASAESVADPDAGQQQGARHDSAADTHSLGHDAGHHTAFTGKHPVDGLFGDLVRRDLRD